MDSFVTDTQALVKFMMGQKVINDRSHQAFQSANKGGKYNYASTLNTIQR